jgi:hypothetical protein
MGLIEAFVLGDVDNDANEEHCCGTPPCYNGIVAKWVIVYPGQGGIGQGYDPNCGD